MPLFTPPLVIRVFSDPDGVLPAQMGTLAINVLTHDVYQNTDGVMAWKGMLAISSRMGAGRYYAMPNTGNGVGTSALLGNGAFRCIGANVPNSITVTRMMAGITSAGDANSKLRLGIYADDGTGRPGALVLDAGTINADSATDQEITGFSTLLTPGNYFFGAAVQGVTVTQPTVRTATSSGIAPQNIDLGTTMPASSATAWGFIMNGVTGALPTTFTVSSTGTSAPRIIVKT